MELVNATPYQAGYTMALQPDGREQVLVVVKGTFGIPADYGHVTLAPAQTPLVEADEFAGEPGFSAPVYETDYSPIKPRCDVLLNGSAYAPGGRRARRVRVELAVGAMRKAFDVVGPRVWQVLARTYGASEPESFDRLPISYGVAFGGVDRAHPDPAKHEFCLANHVGVGFHRYLTPDALEGQPLPLTEEPGRAVADPQGDYRPMAFGPIGRAWSPRPSFAGTYDDDWLEHTFPFLPEDFDERYYQAAPADQQIAHPTGGELVTLTNLTPSGLTEFMLPDLRLPVAFFLRNYEEEEVEAIVDTIVIEPDECRLLVTWKAGFPLKRDLFEVAQAVVGKMPPGWYRARELGKEFYPSLAALAQSRNEED
jgi:hypothetical protein